MTASGEKIFTSAKLARLWPFGFSSVGDVTFGSAAYVARYHVKKLSEEVSRDHYLNPRTGELMAPEYVTMSRRPGIGTAWYRKFSLDMYPSDVRIIAGVKQRPAKFYDGLYEADNAEDFRRIKMERVARVDRSDNDDFRLAVKEEVKMASVKLLRRSLED